jgi:hypothetical protein
MGKTISPSAKKVRSVGSEIIEALENAVAYAKGDHGKGRAHQVLVARESMSGRCGVSWAYRRAILPKHSG